MSWDHLAYGTWVLIYVCDDLKNSLNCVPMTCAFSVWVSYSSTKLYQNRVLPRHIRRGFSLRAKIIWRSTSLDPGFNVCLAFAGQGLGTTRFDQFSPCGTICWKAPEFLLVLPAGTFSHPGLIHKATDTYLEPTCPAGQLHLLASLELHCSSASPSSQHLSIFPGPTNLGALLGQIWRMNSLHWSFLGKAGFCMGFQGVEK